MCEANKPTFLHLAVTVNQIETVETLIKNGSDVNAQDKIGKTPLHHLAPKTRKIVQLLLRSNPNLNIRDRRGETSLFAAVRSRNPEIVRLLINNGSDVNSVNAIDESTPLQMAAQINDDQSHLAVAQTLLESGAKANARNQYGNTALHFTVQNSRNCFYLSGPMSTPRTIRVSYRCSLQLEAKVLIQSSC